MVEESVRLRVWRFFVRERLGEKRGAKDENCREEACGETRFVEGEIDVGGEVCKKDKICGGRNRCGERGLKGGQDLRRKKLVRGRVCGGKGLQRDKNVVKEP